MHYELYLDAVFRDAYKEITEENYEDSVEEESSLNEECTLQDDVEDEDIEENEDDVEEDEDIEENEESDGSCSFLPQMYLSLVGMHARRYAKIRYRSADEPLTYERLFQLLYLLHSTNCMSWNPETEGIVTFHKAPGNLSPRLMELEEQVALLLARQPNLWKGFMAFMDALPEDEQHVSMEAEYRRCFGAESDYYPQPDAFHVDLGHGQNKEQ